MWALRGGINRLRFHCILAALSGISILKSERQIKPYYRFITFCDSYNDFNDEDEKDEKESRKGLSTKVSTSWLARNFVAEAADIVSPSVVNILCETKGNFVKRVSSGSGFIYSKDGYIVTNEHVVAQSSDGRVLVTMWNSMKRQGIVHSVDKQSDIAIVKLLDVRYDEDLPVATMGSSGKLHIGEFVVALGSPLFLSNSITFGIVSATARHGTELGMAHNRTSYIQTDAAINGGNSGGPLVNLDGEVVGINSMKINGSDGIGFAIPIDTAIAVIRQLIANKCVVRPYVGMTINDFTEANNKRVSMRDKKGMSHYDISVIVMNVEKGSPAHKSGIESGDFITHLEGKKVKGVNDVLTAIGVEADKTITLGIRKQSGEAKTVRILTVPEHGRIKSK